MEQKTVDNSRSLLPLFTLADFPMELLVCIISFVTSARDRVKLRYVSQRLRAAVGTPLLWREFTWPHFDFREEQSIRNALKLCGRYVERLSFPNLMIPVKSLQHCGNVLRLSLPSVRLSLYQLKTVMQYMKKLQYLDIMWISKNDIKYVLMMVNTIKDLMIREQVKDSSVDEALLFLLNECTALRILPHTINIVLACVSTVLIARVLDKWLDSGISRSADHIGYLNIYRSFNAVLVPPPPVFQYQIYGPYGLKPLFVNASNYGLLGLKSDQMLLTSRTISNEDVIHNRRDLIHKGSDVIHKAVIGDTDLQNTVHASPLKVNSIKFMTHFSATGCDFFYPGHLEQLAIACPNLQQLNLRKNANCLKRLQGLRAIATGCQKLEGLNIASIPVGKVESLIQLWEILANLQLTYISIDLCCLLGDTKTRHIIISLHRKCLQLKALESYRINGCRKCLESDWPLQLSNFPLLIHLVIGYFDFVNISKTLRYLWYNGNNIWWPENCNLQELFIQSNLLAPPDCFMKEISAHGGLVHVILSVKRVTLNGIAVLIKNSPRLVTYHVHVQTKADSLTSKDIRLALKKFSHRKLFLCGSFHFRKEAITMEELDELLVHGNMDIAPLWRNGL